jgi:hypothetical protein
MAGVRRCGYGGGGKKRHFGLIDRKHVAGQSCAICRWLPVNPTIKMIE